MWSDLTGWKTEAFTVQALYLKVYIMKSLAKSSYIKILCKMFISFLYVRMCKIRSDERFSFCAPIESLNLAISS